MIVDIRIPGSLLKNWCSRPRLLAKTALETHAGRAGRIHWRYDGTYMRSCLPVVVLASATLLAAQNVDPGKLVFESRCARCHGADGSGGEMGPDIRSRAASKSDGQ